MPYEYPVEGIWTYLVMMAALIGFFLILRLLILQFYDLPDFLAVLLALVGLVCIPLFRIWFIYDLPNLFIFSAALLLMARQNWKLYYPVFLIACFTKETSALLPFILFVSYHVFTGSKRAWLTHVAVQSTIWSVIFVVLRLSYQSNPGSLMEFHLLDRNLPLLWRDPGIFLELNRYLMPGQLNIALLIFLGFFIFRDWSIKPLFLRRSLLALVPILTLASLFGILEETRQYLEMYPILLLLCLPTVMRVFRFESEL